MTKVSVFGTEKKKPIELVKIMKNDGSFEDSCAKAIQFDNVQLFYKSTVGYFDIILLWNDNKTEEKAVYLGHWNDGFVE